MADEPTPEEKKKAKRLERKAKRQQPDNDGAFAQYFAEINADGIFDQEAQKYTAGKFKGKTLNEATLLARDEFAALNKSTPGFADKYGARARGEDVIAGPASVEQLPEKLRRHPNAPDLSGLPVFDKTGKQIAGPSPSAAARFMDSVNRAATRQGNITRAVEGRKEWQAKNPEAMVDRATASRDAQLAQSGISDFGGGVRAMANKYGTGFAGQPLTPEQMATRKPGTIIDEKGVVDTAGMMANKGVGTTTPYIPGTENTPALNMDAGDAIKSGIQANIAAAIPGADQRRAADRLKAIDAIKGAVPAPVDTASASPAMKTRPTTAGLPLTEQGLPDDRPGVASAVARNQAFNSPEPTEGALPRTAQGLPDDRPSVASTTARKQAFPSAAVPQPAAAPITPQPVKPVKPPSPKMGVGMPGNAFSFADMSKALIKGVTPKYF